MAIQPNEAIEAAPALGIVPDAQSTPEETLAWAAEQFSPNIAVSCSFGGIGGMVLAHMVARYTPTVPLLFIDTQFLFPETYELRRRWEEQLGLRVLDCRPDLSPAEQASQYGENLWENDPDLCCQLRKVEPMGRAIKNLNAWITSLRRDQSTSRQQVRVLEIHQTAEGRKIVKINPLAHWTRKQVWDYVVTHDIPYNPLLDQGYKSLGCTHCTQPCLGECTDERAGRWAGRAKTECGLHTFTRVVGN